MPSLALEEVRHRVAVAGCVTNAITGQGIIGIVVEVIGQNLQTQTREDGSFYFLDLPIGQYELTISGSRLGKYYQTVTETISVTVADSAEGKPIFDPQAKIQLQPTQLKGQVTRQDNNQAIVGAVVKLRGSGVQMVTDKEGKYTFSELPASTQTVQVRARNFSSVTQKITLIAGEETTMNFQLA